LLSSLKLSFKERTKVYGYSVSVRQAGTYEPQEL